MSAIIVLPILIPPAMAAWPILVAAAGAAATALGFAATRTEEEVEVMVEVELAVDNAAAVTDQLAVGQELVFAREDVQLIVFRDVGGKVGVRVCGRNKTEAELQAIGQEMANALTQQYAYHRLKTELEARHFSVVGEEVEEDGTVRLQVRTFQG